MQKPAPGSKRPAVGFAYGESIKYGKLTTSASQINTKQLTPTPGSFRNAPGAVARFSMTSGRNEWVRLTDRPILVRYIVWRKNLAHDPNAAAGTDNSREWVRCVAADYNISLNPGQGAASFISQASVSLDGHDITQNIQMGDLTRIYRVFNTLTSTEAERKRDGRHMLFKVDADRKANANSQAPPWKAGMALVRGSSLQSRTPNVASFRLDGVPLLGAPRNNALNNLDLSENKVLNTNSFLPPQTRLDVELKFSNQAEMMLDFASQTDALYFTNDTPMTEAVAATNDTPAREAQPRNLYEELKIEIVSVELTYETLTPTAEREKESLIRKSKLPVHVDLPHINTVGLAGGSQYCFNEIPVREGTKLLYLAYMYGHALWPDTTSGKSCVPLLNFPKAIDNIKLELADHGCLIASEIGDPSGEPGYNNSVMHGYVNNLRSTNMTSDEFHEIVPDPGTSGINYSYLQAFAIDLRLFHIDEPTQLKITTRFSAANPCPDSLYLVLCCVREGQLVRTPEKTWKLKVIAP